MPSTLLLSLAAFFGVFGASQAACHSYQNVELTFYGYPDNDPPGAAIAYNCGRSVAGGSGTYNDPLTMASAQGEWKQCEILYVPYLKKYVRYEDYCAQCTSDWNNGGKRHIDIWTGSSTRNGGNDQVDCENELTPNGGQGIVRYPSASYEVDTTGLYSNQGHCRVSHTHDGASTSKYC